MMARKCSNSTGHSSCINLTSASLWKQDAAVVDSQYRSDERGGKEETFIVPTFQEGGATPVIQVNLLICIFIRFSSVVRATL
mmetsp:Transcript_21941/g.47647  ORF Transcript_21941/g.47647 Transcript_21941/m.47647 type:complete len:82 (-) Transcript_21941:294-539(-)